MGYLILLGRIVSTFACMLMALSSWAADYPAPQEAMWVARDFRFHTCEVMPQLQLRENIAGHGTTGMAKFYQRELGELLQSAPRTSP